jgi:hypothetical protein
VTKVLQKSGTSSRVVKPMLKNGALPVFQGQLQEILLNFAAEKTQGIPSSGFKERLYETYY